MLKLLRVFLTYFVFASGTCSCIGLYLFLNMRNVTARCLVKRWNLPLVKRWCLPWMSPGGGCHCSVVGILLILFRYSWGIFFPEWIHMLQQRWSDQSSFIFLGCLNIEDSYKICWFPNVSFWNKTISIWFRMIRWSLTFWNIPFSGI